MFTLLFITPGKRLQLYKNSAVRIIQLRRQSIHHDHTLLIVDGEVSDGVRILVQAAQMLTIREDHEILRIFTADGQDGTHVQQTGLLIPLVEADAVVTGVCTEQGGLIRSQLHSVSRVDGVALARQRGNELLELEYRMLALAVIVKSRNIIL